MIFKKSMMCVFAILLIINITLMHSGFVVVSVDNGIAKNVDNNSYSEFLSQNLNAQNVRKDMVCQFDKVVLTTGNKQ